MAKATSGRRTRRGQAVETYTVPQVYAWMTLSMVAGAAFMLYLGVLAVKHSHVIQPSKSLAVRRAYEEVMTRVMVCPIDEEAGLTNKE